MRCWPVSLRRSVISQILPVCRSGSIEVGLCAIREEEIGPCLTIGPAQTPTFGAFRLFHDYATAIRLGIRWGSSVQAIWAGLSRPASQIPRNRAGMRPY